MKLFDLLHLEGFSHAVTDCKLHFAVPDKNYRSGGPLEKFLAGGFEKWQQQQTKKNFSARPYVVSLIQLDDKTRWLLAGVYRVLSKEPNKIAPTNDHFVGIKGPKPDSLYIYDTKEEKETVHLAGRVVVGFRKTDRVSYPLAETYAEKLHVVSIREERLSIGEFPGFNNIDISFSMLETLMSEQNQSWKGALVNMSGVYLISDATSGKLYVGSAYGGQGIWQRWSEYVRTGHGGNKELKRLLQDKGMAHRMNFKFTLLEFCDPNSSNEYIIGRENHWKTVLLSREFGLNEN